MKFYITYFYNIRFLTPNTLPLSTAVWDPKWFHGNLSQDYVFEDKRGVYNGFRIEELSPLKVESHSCEKTCIQNSNNCDFKRDYHNYIFSLNFEEIKDKIMSLAESLQKRKNLRSLPDICLLVHEKPDNPCSERSTLVEWFSKNGIDLIEFSKKS